ESCRGPAYAWDSCRTRAIAGHSNLGQAHDLTGVHRAYVRGAMTQTLEQPVIRGVRFFLAHTPGLVCYGSKPRRDIARDATIADTIAAHLRSYEAAVAYPPNRAFLGHLPPDTLAS